jgi:hypothetical protein
VTDARYDTHKKGRPTRRRRKRKETSSVEKNLRDRRECVRVRIAEREMNEKKKLRMY